MYSNTTVSQAQAYHSVELNSRIGDASPHALIQLMMDRALARIGLAKRQLQDGNIQDKGSNITGAISIVGGLQASLNHKHDARIAGNFDALYSYITQRLLEANLMNDVARLDEVASLLGELKEAWDAIADKVASAVDE